MTVAAFRVYQLYNVPEALRMLAQQIESGDVSGHRVVVVLEGDDAHEGQVDYRAFGADFTVAHAVGLLHICARRIMAQDDEPE